MNGKHATEVLEYARSIAEGRKVACAEQIQGCRRFLDDLESGRWEFRPRDADFVIGIIERTFRHRQGQALDGSPLRGKPLLLQPWQKFIVYNLLGFYIPGTQERRFKEALIYVPRKTGKTLFTSALAWALALLERMSGSVVYVVGAALKQAMESFENWRYNLTSALYPDKAAALDDGWRILDNNMEHSISHDGPCTARRWP
jgi:phage terminase large subunit-like protein